MGPGEENSGKLVTEVRKAAKEMAMKKGADFILNDGPPGIGCATISSLSGTNMVLMVTEPSKSGLHDAQRLVELTRSFTIPVMAIINKHDINPGASGQLKAFLANKNIPVLAEIPFDEEMVKSMLHEKSIIEYNPGSEITKTLEKSWKLLQKKLV
jgi:MinD superfamily P-loop ATPase